MHLLIMSKFGGGGQTDIHGDFNDVAQMKKPHHAGWGPGSALGPWKLLSFKCLNMDPPYFRYLSKYILKYILLYTDVLLLCDKIFCIFMYAQTGDNQVYTLEA